jgi:hypothetical protein
MTAIASAFVCGSLAGQGRVSPAAYEQRAGNTCVRGFSAGDRIQQIHGDLRGPRSSIDGIAFRQGRCVSQSWGSQDVDVEIWIGESDYDGRSPRFADNFRGTPTRAMPRRTLRLPDFRQPPQGGYPGPFVIRMPFDAPWAYAGDTDLVFQVDTHQLPSDLYGVDGFDWRYNELYGGVPYGLGCVATGQSAPMQLFGSIETVRDPDQFDVRLFVGRTPPYAKSLLLLGTQQVGYNWPVLCTYVYADAFFHALYFFADGSGGFSTAVRAAFDPALVFWHFYAQAFSLDNGRHPMLLPVSATNGLDLEFPPLPAIPVRVATVWGNLSEPNGTVFPWGSVTLFLQGD